MLSEVLDALALRPDGVYMDLTYGRGGHAAGILQRLGPEGRLIVMDRDPEAISAARQRLGNDSRVTIRKGSFANVGAVAEELGISGRVMGVLIDLGVSSAQLDDPRRGFSFKQDGPLDMRMDTERGETAAEWLARAPREEIERVLREFGEERFAGRVARAIVAERAVSPIRTTWRLRDIVARAVPTREPGKDPATRTFQAVRIRINQELDALVAFLGEVIDVLAPAGRLVVISFHSLEDRIVKRFIRRETRGEALPRGLPVRDVDHRARLRAIGRARRPTPAEIAANPRSRSAVLRVAEKIS
jgi:16S rRNA (cytosine1402-N4)-methyltransferase